MDLQKDVSVVDVFCGIGGISQGFRQAGFAIAAGIDADEHCRYAFETNNRAAFLNRDVMDLDASELAALFRPSACRVLIGCAPCQPFSAHARAHRRGHGEDVRWRLLPRFVDMAVALNPDIVVMENVPHLRHFRGGALIRTAVNTLEQAGYEVVYGVMYGPDYGLPQKRSRLMLVASRMWMVRLPPPTHERADHPTVHETIGHLPPLAAGGADALDPLHRCRNLSPLNLERIRASRPGGTWADWPPHLVASCHQRAGGRTFSTVYGRMRGDQAAPTLTTQFYNYGSGRFGHPDRNQNRAISLREGALLQGFARDYAFVPPATTPAFEMLGRQIGNAVPVPLARAVAASIGDHLRLYA